MKKFLLGLWLVFALCFALGIVAGNWARVEGQRPELVYGNNSGTIRPISVDGTGDIVLSDNDPCASSGVAKSQAVVDVTADAIVVALVASQVTYVCGWSLTTSGTTTPTWRWQSGTGTACATSTDQLSGVMPSPTGATVNNIAVAGTVLKSSAGEDLCIDVAGTSPSIQGTISYVQQ